MQGEEDNQRRVALAYATAPLECAQHFIARLLDAGKHALC